MIFNTTRLPNNHDGSNISSDIKTNLSLPSSDFSRKSIASFLISPYNQSSQKLGNGINSIDNL